MATLYITEYQDTPATKNGIILPSGAEPNVGEQAVPITGASIQSAVFSPKTSFIMVNCDATCSLAFGDNPAAVATAHRMSANETRFYGVVSGQRIAVITNT